MSNFELLECETINDIASDYKIVIHDFWDSEVFEKIEAEESKPSFLISQEDLEKLNNDKNLAYFNFEEFEFDGFKGYLPGDVYFSGDQNIYKNETKYLLKIVNVGNFQEFKQILAKTNKLYLLKE